MTEYKDSFFSRLRSWANQGIGRVITIGAAIAVLAVAGAWFVLRNPQQQTVKGIQQRGQSVLYFCTACRASGEMRVSYDATWPQPCPQCRQPKAVHGFRCRKCKAVVPTSTGAVSTCLSCGATYANPQMPGGLPQPPTRR